MTGALGEADLPAPIGDRWFEDYVGSKGRGLPSALVRCKSWSRSTPSWRTVSRPSTSPGPGRTSAWRRRQPWRADCSPAVSAARGRTPETAAPVRRSVSTAEQAIWTITSAKFSPYAVRFPGRGELLRLWL